MVPPSTIALLCNTAAPRYNPTTSLPGAVLDRDGAGREVHVPLDALGERDMPGLAKCLNPVVKLDQDGENGLKPDSDLVVEGDDQQVGARLQQTGAVGGEPRVFPESTFEEGKTGKRTDLVVVRIPTVNPKGRSWSPSGCATGVVAPRLKPVTVIACSPRAFSPRGASDQ